MSLITYIELNQKYGYGYQARMIRDGIESVLDEPVIENLGEITSAIVGAIEEINRQTGRSYKPHEVIRLDADAIEINKRYDITSAQVDKDIRQGRGRLTYPDGADFTKTVVDGEEQEIISLRGTLLISYDSWKNYNKPKGETVMQMYCKYLVSHGYGAGQAEIFKELESMEEAQAWNWIKATHGRYVKDESTLFNEIVQTK